MCLRAAFTSVLTVALAKVLHTSAVGVPNLDPQAGSATKNNWRATAGPQASRKDGTHMAAEKYPGFNAMPVQSAASPHGEAGTILPESRRMQSDSEQHSVVLVPGLLSALGLDATELTSTVLERHSELVTAANPLEWDDTQQLGATSIQSQVISATGGASTVEVGASSNIACIQWLTEGGGRARAFLLSPDAGELAVSAAGSATSRSTALADARSAVARLAKQVLHWDSRDGSALQAILQGCDGRASRANRTGWEARSGARLEPVVGILGDTRDQGAGISASDWTYDETLQKVVVQQGLWASADSGAADEEADHDWINAWQIVVPLLVLLAGCMSLCAGARLMHADAKFRKWPSMIFPVASMVGGMLQVVAVAWVASGGRPGASAVDATASDALREEVFRNAADSADTSHLRAVSCASQQYAVAGNAGLMWSQELQEGLPDAESEASRHIPIPGPLPACAIEANGGNSPGIAADALWTAESTAILDPERVAIAASLQTAAKPVVVRVTIGAGCAVQGVLSWSMTLAGRTVMIWLLELLLGAMKNPELKGDKLGPFAAETARDMIVSWAFSSIFFGAFAGIIGVWRPGVEGCKLEGPGIARLLFALPQLYAALGGVSVGWAVYKESTGYLNDVAEAEAMSKRLQEEEEAERQEEEDGGIDWGAIG